MCCLSVRQWKTQNKVAVTWSSGWWCLSPERFPFCLWQAAREGADSSAYLGLTRILSCPFSGGWFISDCLLSSRVACAIPTRGFVRTPPLWKALSPLFVSSALWGWGQVLAASALQLSLVETAVTWGKCRPEGRLVSGLLFSVLSFLSQIMKEHLKCPLHPPIPLTELRMVSS